MIDLLETKRLKDAIENDPKNFHVTIEKAQIGICITDANGYFLAVNEKYCHIFGYKKEELLGNHFSIVFPESKRKEVSLIHDNFIKNQLKNSRNEEGKTKLNQPIKLSIDTVYSEKLNGKPTKITFIQPE